MRDGYRSKKRLSRPLVWAFCCFAVGIAGTASVRALDYGDVKNLLSNSVPENVIVNMAEIQGGLYLSEAEKNELRSLGASENLVAGIAKTVEVETATAPEPVLSSTSACTTTEPPVVYESAQSSAVTPLPVAVSGAYPPLCNKEGWLSVSNRDSMPYYLMVDGGKPRMFISRAPNGGAVINPGENVVLNVKREGYKLYGDSGRELRVKVREGLTTTLTLEPFGVVGNSGLTGVAVERDNVRSEVLFNNYAPTPAQIIVEQPPTVIVPAPRPSAHYYYYSHPRYRGYYW